jgi:hypothetical protein
LPNSNTEEVDLMRIRLLLVVGLLALAVALPVTPADAGSARLGTLSIQCDGTVRHESFQASGFPASSNQFVLGGEVTAVDTKGKLRYLLSGSRVTKTSRS